MTRASSARRGGNRGQDVGARTKRKETETHDLELDDRPGHRNRGAARRRPQALPRPGHHRGGAADGGARRLGGDHRPALGPAGPAHLDGQPRMDADGLHAGLCRVAAPRWPHRRLLRAQAHVRDQPDRLRGRLCAGRPGAERRHALQRPGAAGRLRRGDGSGRPLAADGRLHRAQGTRPCLRRLRRHRRRRRGHRPHPRRLPDRVRLVALDTAHQRADRHRRRTGGPPRRHGEPESVQPRVRPPGCDHRHRWSAGAGLRLHQGGQRRLELLGDADPLRHRRRCSWWHSSPSSTAPRTHSSRSVSSSSGTAVGPSSPRFSSGPRCSGPSSR